MPGSGPGLSSRHPVSSTRLVAPLQCHFGQLLSCSFYKRVDLRLRTESEDLPEATQQVSAGTVFRLYPAACSFP